MAIPGAQPFTPQQLSWLALCRVGGMGGSLGRKLVRELGSADAILNTPPATLIARHGVPAQVAQRLHGARDLPAARIEARLAQEQAVRLLPWDDPDYPSALRSQAMAPLLLYCQGIWPLAGPWLAVVGTRTATPYGEAVTRDLLASLARLAPATVVVSGLARGIDTLAHRQALASGLRTVAVMAGGLARIYPPENEALAQEMRLQGALLSEYSMMQPPLARNFPMRNRIIAGLADALLVVEAGERSGALITAGWALHYGRPVLAVPGNLAQPGSVGTNRLIATGQARLVRGAEDLMAALNPDTPVRYSRVPASAAPLTPGALPPPPSPSPPDGPKAVLLHALQAEPLHPDDLAERAGLPVERLLGLLLEMELSGDIVQTPENKFALPARRGVS